MSLISRITTWAAGQLLKSADLNGEFNNIVNTLNNLDAGSTPWTNVSTTNLTATNITPTTIDGNIAFDSTSTHGIRGTVAADNAAAGNVGEQFLATAFSAGNAAGTNVFGNICSVTLTAGDWDVTGQAVFFLNGATVTACEGAVSLFSGNTRTDHNEGDNVMLTFPPTAAIDNCVCIANWRVNVTTSTNVFLKGLFTYSAGTPQMGGRLSARRIR